MRHTVTIVALALTIAVSACTTGAKDEGFTRADQDAIRKNSADLVAAFNRKQLDTIAGLFADNSVFMPPTRRCCAAVSR